MDLKALARFIILNGRLVESARAGVRYYLFPLGTVSGGHTELKYYPDQEKIYLISFTAGGLDSTSVELGELETKLDALLFDAGLVP